jgi:hypothetical protein
MGSISDKLTYLLDTKAAIRQAIRNKGVEVTSEDTFRSYADKIDAIDGGQLIVSREVPTVIFYDYDGSIAHSYTAEEALSLTSMPEQPQHDLLTRQGWNRSYEEMRSIVQECGWCAIEPLYVTSDGYTRLFVTIDALGRQKYPLYITASVAGSVSVNWGDGSEDEVFSDLEIIDTYHYYKELGDYVITVKTTEGTITLSDGTSSYSDFSNAAYKSMLTKVYLGSNVEEIKKYSFYYNINLSCVTAHNAISNVGTYAFWGCSSLALFPMTDLAICNDYSFVFCWELKTARISSNQTGIAAYQFAKCFALNNIYLPDNITQINSFSFFCSESLENIRFSNNLTVIGTNAFTNSGIKYFNPPVSLINVNSQAFSSSKLKKVYISYRTTISFSYLSFAYCPELEEFICDAVNSSINVTVVSNSLNLKKFEFKATTDSLGGSTNNSSVNRDFERNYTTTFTSFSVQNCGFYGLRNLRFVEFTFNTSTSSLLSYGFYQHYGLVGCVLRGTVKGIGSYAFYQCTSLKYVDLSNIQEVVTLAANNFSGCPNDFVVIVPDDLVESYKVAANWSMIADHIVGSYQPAVCTRLQIEADDVAANQSTTTIRWTAITNGYDPRTGDDREGVVVTGTATSEDFGINESYDNTVTHTISFTYMEVTATTTITQAAKLPKNYTIDLNNQWRESTSVANPDSATYEGVYESFSNYNVNNGTATMYIDIDGYTEFKLYIRSHAESSYDYVMVGALDQVPTTSSNYANTKGAQNSGTAISNYKLVTFSNIDGAAHRITIIYRKDSSQHQGADRGFVLIPKEQ